VRYKYLIVGGGMTADAAVRGIRDVDSTGAIGLIGAEAARPYDRPPLTKDLWQDKSLDTIWRHTEEQQVELHLGCRVERIDVRNKEAKVDNGDTHTFDKLLLATGGRPRRLPFDDDDIIYYRTVEDYQRLRDTIDQSKRYVVIGGGFIGSEIAAALAMKNAEVTIVFPESGIGGRLFPEDLCKFLNDYYRDKGVEVLANRSIKGIERRSGRFVLAVSEGPDLPADVVVAGIGIEPNVELAASAELKVDNGIVVDEYLRTSCPDIYAAGDVASFRFPGLDTYTRFEHEDNANTMGTQAGRNMAGADEPYDHLPYFYSDLFDLGYEAVGRLDAELDTVADWGTPFQKGVVYYLRQDRVRGVLLWNVWDQVDAARDLIASRKSISSDALSHRLQHIKEKKGSKSGATISSLADV